MAEPTRLTHSGHGPSLVAAGIATVQSDFEPAEGPPPLMATAWYRESRCANGLSRGQSDCNKCRGAYASTRRKRLRKTMSGIHIRQLLAGLVAFAFVMALVSLALVYFFPAPPSTITLATAFKGSSFDYFGQQYRERLARDHVNLELRETAGAVENLKLLQDPDSGVDAAFVAGGISNSKHAPGLLSL